MNLCSKTGKGSFGSAPPTDWTASAIRVSPPSRLKGLGKDLATGILASRDGTIWVANYGSLDRIRDGTVTSIGRSVVFRGTRSPRCSRTAPATCGWA